MKTTFKFAKEKKNIKKDVMSYAWKLARKQAKKDGCSTKECFAWALKMAWDVLKMLCTARYGFREESPKDGAFISFDSFYYPLAEEYPHIFYSVYAIYDDDRRETVYFGSLKQCEDFRFNNSVWHEHFGHIVHSSYISGLLAPLLWV